MKKYLSSILPFLAMAIFTCTFSACGSDDDDDKDSSGGSKGGLIGYWIKDDYKEGIGYSMDKKNTIDEDGYIDGSPASGYCTSWQGIYHFIDNNTLEKILIRASIVRHDGSFKTETINGIPVYLYFDFDDVFATTYTYEKIDNKIYIASAGEILTYNGSTIKKDGDSGTFIKIK